MGVPGAMKPCSALGMLSHFQAGTKTFQFLDILLFSEVLDQDWEGNAHAVAFDGGTVLIKAMPAE